MQILKIVNSKEKEIGKATIEAIESMSEKIPKEEIAGLEEAINVLCTMHVFWFTWFIQRL